MNLFRLPDREKTTNELTRRYEEALRKAEKGIHDDEEAQQFVSLLAHYVYYIKKADVTQRAIKELFDQQELIAGDEILVEEADKIIAQMKIDRGKLVSYAKKKKINVEAYQFREGVQQITGDMEFSFYLHLLDQFLKRPSDQQSISEVPKEIGHLLSMNFSAQNLGGETKALQKMRAGYRKVQNEFARCKAYTLIICVSRITEL